MLIKYVPIVLAVFLIETRSALAEENVVFLKQGAVAGRTEETLFGRHAYISFRGIPYAEPPTGDLRFKPPQAHGGWEGTYEATDDKPSCLQNNGRMRAGEEYGISGSEDCLYLSIFTPSTSSSSAVVVFEYNDNFRATFNGTSTYGPDFFVEEDVVVVHISHRVGLLGYLTTEDPAIPANAGLKDFILALRWIKENIQHFGGDANRVTLMGNSGGAALAEILLYSEKAEGLFHRVTLQSGSALASIFFADDARESAFRLGEAFDIKTDDSEVLLKELQNLDASDLLTKEREGMSPDGFARRQRSVYPFSPVVDGDSDDPVIKNLPESSRIVNDVPVLIGFNSRDGLDSAAQYLFEPRFVKEAKITMDLHFPIRTDFRFDIDSRIYREAVSDIKEFYLNGNELSTNNIEEFSVYNGDTLHLYAIDAAVKDLSLKLNSNVFYYLFDFNGAWNENLVHITRRARATLGKWGATVTDELCYLQLCRRMLKKYKEVARLPSQQPEQKLMKVMVKLWTNFAKYGNPTPTEKDAIKGVIWEPVDKQSITKKYLHIQKKITIKTDPMRERFEFWTHFLEKYSKLSVDGVIKDISVEHQEL